MTGRSPSRSYIVNLVVAVLAVGLSVVVRWPVASAGASSAPSSSAGLDPVAIARASAEERGSRVEVPSLMDEYSDTYANPDGTMTTETSSTPLRVERDGVWVDVDYDLQHVYGGWSPKVSPVPVVFSDGADKDAAAVGTGAREVDLSWDVALPVPRIVGPKAIYDLGSGQSLVLIANATGFEQSLVLAAPPSSLPQIRLPFDTSNLTMVSDGAGGYTFDSAAGAAVYTMPAPIMYSAYVDPETGAPQAQVVQSSLTQTAVGGRMDLSPSMAWLTDPSTVYPVTIDPTVMHVGGGADTYAQSNQTTAQGSTEILHAGEFAGSYPARAYLKWTSGLASYAGKHIVSSTLTLWNYVAASCTSATIHAYPLTSSFTTGGTVWTNKPTFTTSSTYAGSASFAHGIEGSCPNAFASIDVTKIVAGWASGALDPANGMQLSGTETSGSQYWGFCSMNYDTTLTTSCNTSDHAPALSITYNDDPDPVDRRSQLPGDAAEVGTQTPTLHAAFSDPDADNGHIAYKVYDATTGSLVASGSGSTVASGSDSPWTVPSGALAAGSSYRWTAQGVDVITPPGIGPVSSFKFFNTQAANQTGDQRRFTWEQRPLSDRTEMKVNVANGNLLLHATDLQIRGTGIDFALDRYYNSRSTATSTLGEGWTLGIGQDVKLLLAGSNPTTSDVTYIAPSGFSARFDYDSTTSTWHHPPGVDATLTHDGTNSEWDLKFFTTEGKCVFNSSGQFVREVDRNGNTISFGYNGSGQMTTATDTQNRVITFSYTNGRLMTVTDSTGRNVSYTYDNNQNLQTFTDAAGKVVTYRYNGDLVNQVTTAENSITQLDYASDGSRRVLDDFGSYDPGNGNPTSATTSFDYQSGLTKVTDPNGNNTTGDSTDGITTYHYDERDRVTTVTDALGHDRSKSYTSNDNVSMLTDSLQKQTTLAWDPNDENLTSVSLPTGAKSTFGYTDAIHPHSVTGSTDPQGNVMAYSYDSPGNRHTETSTSSSPAALLLTIDHNSNGTVSKITDGNSNATSYGYDSNGNLNSVDNPAPLGDVSYAPDALSRVHTMTDGKGQTTTYTYDTIDRPNVTTFNDASTVDQDYDGDGNLTKVTDATGVTTFAYDKMQRQIRKTVPSNEQLRYSYDHNGNLTSYTDSGGTITYGYNQVNLVTSLAEPGGDCTTTPVTNPCTTFQYDNNNRRTQTSYPTSPATVMTAGYDDSGRETSIKTTVGSSTLTSFTYNYQKNGADTGLRQSVTDLSGTTNYGYDVLNRLTSTTGALARSYTYDLAFNRKTKTVSGTQITYAYNNANELTTVNGANTYNYDGNGNITSGGGGWASSYNAKNQTTSTTQPGGTALTPQAYAGTDQNERVQAGTTTYVNSALGLSSATTSSATIYYTRDNNGNLVSLRTPTARYYYLFDGLGSVIGLIDNTGAKINSYGYDPYGEQLSATETVANPWRYAAGQYDGATGLTKFGVRYYNPAEGRFTQRDPSGKDLPYAYAADDSTNETDPSGNFSVGEFFGGLGDLFLGVTEILSGAGLLALGSAVGGPLGAAVVTPLVLTEWSIGVGEAGSGTEDIVNSFGD